MERYQRSNALVRKAYPSRQHYRKKNRDVKQIVDREPRARAESPGDSVQQRRIGKLDLERSIAALNDNDDYVRNWLVQTESSTIQDVHNSAEDQKRPTSKEGHLAHPVTTFDYSTFDLEITTVQKRTKRKHNSSSDSSILESPIRKSESQPLVPKLSRSHARERTEKASTPPRKKQRIETSDSEISHTSIEPQSLRRETFEKRSRHKTHEDRYEPTRKDRKHKQSREKKLTKTKREKKDHRKKAAKRSGANLMQNFSSKSIAQERLTIRHSNGPGIFKNGRASSPVRSRGLPDLAFSEMDFLRHSTRHPPAVDTNKVKSMSREKEKRKLSRAAEEISEFFNASRLPLPQSNSIHISSPSIHTRHEYLRSSQRLQPYQSRQMSSYSQISLLPKTPCPDSSKISTSPERRLASHKFPILQCAKSVANWCSKPSGPERTSVSWSETQPSPTSLPQRLPNVVRPPSSSIPDSVRRSIAETGIFKDTGLNADGLRLRRFAPMEKISTATNSGDSNTNLLNNMEMCQGFARDLHQSVIYSAAPLTAASLSHENNNMQRSAVFESHPEQSEQTKLLQNGGSLSTHTYDNPVSKDPKISVLEHFDTHLGSQQKITSSQDEHPSAASSTKVNTTHGSKGIPIDRGYLAKYARIKRPSTNLLVTQKTVEVPVQLRDITMADGVEDTQKSGEANQDKDAVLHLSDGGIVGSGIARQPDSTRIGSPNWREDTQDCSDSSSKLRDAFEKPALLAPIMKRKFLSPTTTRADSTISIARGDGLSLLGLPYRGSLANIGANQSLQSPRNPLLNDQDSLFIRQVTHHPPLKQNFYHGDDRMSLQVAKPYPWFGEGVISTKRHKFESSGGIQHSTSGPHDYEQSPLDIKNEVWNFGRENVEGNLLHQADYRADGYVEYEIMFNDNYQIDAQQETEVDALETLQPYEEVEQKHVHNLYDIHQHLHVPGFWRPNQW